MAKKIPSDKLMSNPSANTSFFPWWQLALLAIAVFVVFQPILYNDFLNFDDGTLILEKPEVVNGNFFGAFWLQFGTRDYKPVTYLLWTLEYKLFGPNPYVFHFNNLLLHIFNTCWIYLISKKLFPKLGVKIESDFLPIVFALLWALHPLKVESVAWAVERKDVLYSFFGLAAIWNYIRYLESDYSIKKYLKYALLLCLTAVLSKAMAITIPLVFMLFDWLWYEKVYLFGKWKLSNAMVKIGAGLAAIGIYTFAVLNHIYFETQYSHLEAPALAPLPSPYYAVVETSFRLSYLLYKFFVPYPLSVLYRSFELAAPIGQAIHLLFPALLASAYFLYKKRFQYKALYFGMLFFVVSVLPVLIIREEAGVYLSDRYQYFASFGLMAALVVMLSNIHKYVLYGLVALFVFYGMYSNTRCYVWKNSEILFSDVLEKYPDNYSAYNNRGDFLKAHKRLDEAMRDFQMAIQLSPRFVFAYAGIANIYFEKLEFQKSIEYFTKAIEMSEVNQRYYEVRGCAYANIGNFEKALADFDTAISKDVYSPIAYENKGIVLNEMKRYDEAIKSYDGFLYFYPDNERVKNLKKKALENKKNSGG